MMPLVCADRALEGLVEHRIPVFHLREVNPGSSNKTYLNGFEFEVPFEEVSFLYVREIKVPKKVRSEIKLIFVCYHLL